MAQEYKPIDISDAPALKRLAEAVRQSGKPHALKQGTETVAVVRPVPAKEPTAHSPRRRRRFTIDDPLWNIVGIAHGAGSENVSGNVDKYLAQAYLDEHG